MPRRPEQESYRVRLALEIAALMFTALGAVFYVTREMAQREQDYQKAERELDNLNAWRLTVESALRDCRSKGVP